MIEVDESRSVRHAMTPVRWALVGAGVVVVVALTAALVVHRLEVARGPAFCADVGLNGPPAASAREALDAYLHQVEDERHVAFDHSMWSQDDASQYAAPGSVAFASPAKALNREGLGLSVIFVGQHADGTWAADGACV